MRPCKKCLLADFDSGGLARSVSERIALLDDSVKADKHTYAQRLDICRECDDLTNGMCAQCGCFAELRAAKKDMRCPVRKWNSVSGNR